MAIYIWSIFNGKCKDARLCDIQRRRWDDIVYKRGLFGSTGAVALSNTGFITWIQIGYNLPITTGSGPNGGYLGAIDEFYVHSRELTQADVTALANP